MEYRGFITCRSTSLLRVEDLQGRLDWNSSSRLN